MAPYESIVEMDGRTKVFVIEDRVAKLKEVTIGVETALFTEILSGLTEGEKVVVSPPQGLMDGGRVAEVAPVRHWRRGGPALNDQGHKPVQGIPDGRAPGNRLADVNINVGPGEFVAIMGPSGSNPPS